MASDLGDTSMSSIRKKQFDDVLVVWYMNHHFPRVSKQRLDEGDYRLLFCLNDETLIQTLSTSSTDDTKILLILPAYRASELLPIVHDNEQIVGIDLLCVQADEIINDYQHLFGIYPKLLGVYENPPSNVPIIEQLRNISKQPYIPILFDRELQSILDLSKFYDEFKSNRLFRSIQLEDGKIDNNKEAFLHICRSICALDPIQLNRIDEFEQNYRPEDAIKWYSKDCFTFKVINELFRNNELFPDAKLGYYVFDLCVNLKLLWLEQQRQNLPLSSTILRLYRGLFVPDVDIDRIKASEGNYISINGFLLTTKSYEMARIIARNVFCEIEVNPQLDNIIFADISAYSRFDEQDVLFSLDTTFFVSSIYYDDDDKLWKIKLIGASEEELIDNQLEYHCFTFDGQQQEFIGDQWFAFRKYDKSISSYEKSLLLITDERNKADIFYKLAKTYSTNKQFAFALDNALDAYKIYMSIHPSNPHIILELLRLIAISYACVDNYDCSIEYHIKYLILAESYDTNWWLTAYCPGSQQNLKSFPGEIHTSLIYGHALTHLLQILTKVQFNNDILAKIHLNIAILYDHINHSQNQGSFKHFKIAKQLFAADSIELRYSIWYFAYGRSKSSKSITAVDSYRKLLKLLHLDNSQLIMIVHYAIARCYFQSNKYNRALHYLHHALKINEKYSTNDELCAKILYIIGWTHSYFDRIDLALEFLEKSLSKHDTLVKVNPINYYDNFRIAKITETISECYLKKDDDENALIYSQMSLEQYLKTAPDYLEKHAYLYFQLAVLYERAEGFRLCVEYFKTSLSIRERLMEYADENLAAEYCLLSMKYQILNQLDSAIESLLKSLELLKTYSSPSLPFDSDMIIVQKRLVALYDEILDYPSALAYSCAMLDILEKMKPLPKTQIALIQKKNGWYYYQIGDLVNALISCQKSFALFQECFPSSNTDQMSPELSYVLTSLGQIYLKLGDRSKALDYCQKSLQTLEHEDETGEYIKSFADNYELLADIFIHYGQQTLSFDYYLKSINLFRQIHGTKKDHSDIQRVLSSLNNINEIEF
ncbi:unnamed protein product [Rotaria sp. Silwood2]|nr:unnamed protein product [Rotaria sp. Silwood2]CAF4008748.1 unnamed protein product [Rotaria sp. Silwood2]CAF4041175.1 unnamed protein product [Rotaria sp. Silwood2]